jgi:uncharacterized protein YndB with AHSA1/START domain
MSHYIDIQTLVHAPLAQAWDALTNPESVRQWNHASDDWHCPKASNDLREGGQFSYTMAAKDGSFSFDLEGSFTLVEAPHTLHYQLADGRKVEVSLLETAEGVLVSQRFEPEMENPEEIQRMGWQAILDNYGRFATR